MSSEVLWPNYQEFTRAPNLRSALNTAWSMWHVHDWIYCEGDPTGDDKGRATYARYVISQCKELAQVRDIANSAKHLVLTRGNPEVTELSSSMRGVFNIGVHGNIPSKIVTVVTSSGSSDLALLFHRGFAFWLEQIMTHPVSFPLPADGRGNRLNEDMLAWCRTNLGDERSKRWKWTYWGGSDTTGVARFSFYSQNDADTFHAHWKPLI